MPRVAPPESGDDLSQFVQAFKEMAHNLDEEGAANLLAWSPLFLPTVEGLMRQGNEAGTRGPRLRTKAHNPPEVRQPAPHPRAQAVAAERLEHMNKLRALYSVEQPSTATPPAAPVVPPPTAAACGACPPTQRAGSCEHIPLPREVMPRQRSPSAPVRREVPMSPSATGDDWEDEVDDLLNWTSGLPNLTE